VLQGVAAGDLLPFDRLGASGEEGVPPVGCDLRFVVAISDVQFEGFRSWLQALEAIHPVTSLKPAQLIPEEWP
jgi:hypothetical protein